MDRKGECLCLSRMVSFWPAFWLLSSAAWGIRYIGNAAAKAAVPAAVHSAVDAHRILPKMQERLTTIRASRLVKRITVIYNGKHDTKCVRLFLTCQ